MNLHQEAIADTKRAINTYKRIDAMVDSLYPSNKLNRPMSARDEFLLNEHRCRTCDKAYTSVEDVKFMDEGNGECFRCDAMRADVMADAKADYIEQMTERAEANGMSVEDYMDEMGVE